MVCVVFTVLDGPASAFESPPDVSFGACVTPQTRASASGASASTPVRARLVTELCSMDG